MRKEPDAPGAELGQARLRADRQAPGFFGMFGFVEATGLVAAGLTTAAFLPQVVETWKARSAAGLSLTMLLVFATGVALWLVYGLGTGQVPVILANGMTLVLVSVLLGLKLRDMRRAEA